MLVRLIICSIACSVTLLGCASMSKEECARANWDAIGYADGSRGEAASRFTDHQKACAEHGFAANFAVYKHGHVRGLSEVFCKPRSGYQLGLRGGSYHNVCPAAMEQDFLAAYHFGREIYQRQRSYDSLRQQSTQMHLELAELDARIDSLQHPPAQANYASSAASHQQRRDTEARYHHIERLTPQARQRNELSNQIHNELSAQQALVEQLIMHLIQRTGKSAHEHNLRTRVQQADESGQLQSQIHWLNRNAKLARTRPQQNAILQQQLQSVQTRVTNSQRRLHPLQLTPQDKADFDFLVNQAEFAGALRHHQELLAHAGDQYTLDLLIDVHFNAVLTNLDTRLRAAGQTDRHSRQAQQRELQDAHRHRADLVRRLDALEHEMHILGDEIGQMKASSGF